MYAVDPERPVAIRGAMIALVLPVQVLRCKEHPIVSAQDTSTLDTCCKSLEVPPRAQRPKAMSMFSVGLSNRGATCYM